MATVTATGMTATSTIIITATMLEPPVGQAHTPARPPAPPRMALAVVSGRWVQLQPWPRMGDRGRLGRDGRRPRGVARRRAPPRRRPERRDPLAYARGPPLPSMRMRSAPSPGSPRRSSHRRSAGFEACAQGAAFLMAVGATWPNPRLAALSEALTSEPAVPYPVAVAVRCGGPVPLGPVLVAYLDAFVANIVSARGPCRCR